MNFLQHYLECIGCGATYTPNSVVYACRSCRDLLTVKYDYRELRNTVDLKPLPGRPISVWRYEQLLPLGHKSERISLGEGGTGLHRCDRLGDDMGLKNLWVKNEGENPTGSFKDRGMTVGVSRAVEVGACSVACASTGNTSASLAAYAAKAGLRCVVLIPFGKIAFGKLAQAIAYGARVIQIEGNFDDALNSVLQLTERRQTIYPLNSVNPYRLEGQKTLAFEVWDQLGQRVPDKVVVPVGNAGNISAIWKGFVELKEIGWIDTLPKMMGIQAEGAAPIAEAFKKREKSIHRVENPETVATAIRIGSPASWKKALRSIFESSGVMETVSDEEILESQKRLARLEGLFVEPASASSIAGLRRLVDAGSVEVDEEVVAVATGHGLKDPEIIIKTCEEPIRTDGSVDSIIRSMGVD
mgnify:CR=1 FL=1